MNSPTLHIVNFELSTTHGGLRDPSGRSLDVEELLKTGFVVSPEDANVILTLVTRFLQNRDATHG